MVPQAVDSPLPIVVDYLPQVAVVALMAQVPVVVAFNRKTLMLFKRQLTPWRTKVCRMIPATLTW